MVDFLIWLITIFLLGVVSFPLSFTILPHLKDRGYAITKVMGLLLWGYVFWVLTMLGVTSNDLGGVLFALVAYVGLNGWLYAKKHTEINHWIKENSKTIILSEVVFLLAFGSWAVVRASNPGIIGTEKPMELAFINAILKSPGFPPNDPWLSGYSISYYYFGYVIVSMLVRITGVVSTVAFNLMVALLFGLVAVSAFGLLNNLLSRRSEQNGEKPLTSAWGVLASFFILILGNMQGFLEMLHAKGIGWTQSVDGGWSSKFWTWLNMPEVENPPSLPLQWAPNRSGGYWWWRASRVVQDFKATGERIEIIDEFPQFTYVLADMHPHVLSMPFVLLAITVALNIYFGIVKNAEEKIGFFAWLRQRFLPGGQAKVQLDDLFIVEWIKEPVFWLITLICGGIGFFNTWDFPVYVGLFSLCVLVFNTAKFGWSTKRVSEFLETGMLTGILGILLYLPFFLSFGSQAGGLLPSINFFTRGIYFWIMFGTLLVPLLIWLIWLAFKKNKVFHKKLGFWGAIGLVFGFWFFSYLIGAGFLFVGRMIETERIAGLYNQFYWLQGGTDEVTILLGSIVKRLQWPFTWITILGGLYLVWGLLFDKPTILNSEQGAGVKSDPSNPDRFVGILVLLGLGLTLVPEFIYLLDQFGNRMNTIFKFYFQTWILWGMAASYGTVMIWKKMTGFPAWIARFASVVFILMGLAYPVFAIWDTSNHFGITQTEQDGIHINWDVLTLDGAAYRDWYLADEMDAINWLKEQPVGVVAEAVGGQYSDYARVATYSGQPTVLGWPGHESQWRGGNEEMGTRETDIEILYRSNNWDAIQPVLEKYQITYVFFGDLETGKYNANNQVFDAYLTRLFAAGDTIVYGYTPTK